MFVERPVGIDLGTTNSEVAILDPSEQDVVVYADRFGRRTVPSAVAWDPAANVFVVGRAARARRGQSPSPIESVKRKMGRPVQVAVGPHRLSPEEVSSKILAELRDRMRDTLSAKAPAGVEVRVERAVITVPAYFDAPQVEATLKAGQLAGLEVLGVLHEPTAAAIYHTWRGLPGGDAETRCFLVYDLGGGTFDVSVLRSTAGEYQVLAIDGDNLLGGDDFDRRFAEKLRVHLAAQGYALELDLTLAEDAARFLRLVHIAQEIKESLSTTDVVSVSKENALLDKAGEAVSLVLDVSRAEYEAAIEDLVEQTLVCARRALAESEQSAGVGLADLDAVILVGGSTRVPLVMRKVEEVLASKTKHAAPPLAHEVDTIVALGAAIDAAQRGGLRLGSGSTRLAVRSPLVTDSTELRLTIAVEEAPTATRRLEVRRGESVLAEADCEAGAVLRMRVPVGAVGAHPVDLVFVDLDRNEHGRVPLTLYRGEVRERASSLSQGAVLAKDLAVEVARGSERAAKVLVRRGARLPVEVQHEFATGDQTGAVVLRLLQNRFPIKTLALEVDRALPVGTPVRVTLRCDESMRIEAKAEVAGHELWAKIDTAPFEADTGRAVVEALVAEAEAARARLWGQLASAFDSEARPLLHALREASGTDPDKVAVCVVQLRAILDGIVGGGELQPSPDVVFNTLSALRRMVFTHAVSTGTVLGLSKEAWAARFADLDGRAQVARLEVDVPAWRLIADEAQALYESVAAATLGAVVDTTESLTARHSTALRGMAEVTRRLDDFTLSSVGEVARVQRVELDRMRGQLLRAQEALVGLPLPTPGASLDELRPFRNGIHDALDVLDRVERGLDRLPSLGLVRER